MSTQVDPTWDKWIERAVTRHFVAALAPLKVFAPDENLNLEGLTNYSKLRIYGSIWKEQTHGHWKTTFTVDVLSIAAPVSNAYEQSDQARNISAAFNPGICVQDPIPNHVLIISRDPSTEGVRTLRLGRRDKGTEVIEHSISCQYKGYI